MTAHGAAHRTTHALAHLALHLALAHLALAHLALHLPLTHGALPHRTGTVLALRALAELALAVLALAVLALLTVAAGTGGQLRRATGQLGRTHLRRLLLDRRAGYGGGHGRAGTILLLRRLAHTLLLLVLRGGTRRGGQLRAKILVLAQQARQFSFDLVEEGIDLVLVIAFSEADGRELLVPHVLGGQRHLYFTST
ncbi:hypothetical protein GCM10010346_03460 [Streptomyces chryseus]|uniref:Secreted protein n=1 Tax=Streptomyces chryseus TaxID=68186 RepID=A0ABQ3DEJ3_9ACTN|nr:hypothetical protein GCM10010346_03460 [Streptomyces chryseus]